MAHSLTYLFFKMKLIEPSADTILDWKDIRAVNKLEFALVHGNYKTRQLAAEALEKVGRSSSIPILLKAMNDKIQEVSIAALNALEALGHNDDLIISITRKRFLWVKHLRDKEEKQKNRTSKKHSIYRWKRASKESFDRVKAQLKKPMR